MIENNPSNVSSAFEMLLEEIEAEMEFVNGVGSRSFESGDYEKAQEALGRANALTAFRGQVAALRKEWEKIAADAEKAEDEETRAERRNLGKLRRGLRTPEEEYYLPILRVLDQMGGRGKVAETLDRVGNLMRRTLKPVDHEPLASDPKNPRWRNAAQWARNSMIHEGLLESNSPRGVWEISEKGRSALKRGATGV